MRWPPHVNLLYPFIEDSETAFAEAARRAQDSVTAVPPFEVFVLEWLPCDIRRWTHRES